MATIFILIAAFVGVACLVGGVASLFMQGEADSAMENRLAVLTQSAGPGLPGRGRKDRGLLNEPLDNIPTALEDFVANFFNLRTLLQQADLQIHPNKFLLLSIGLACLGMVLVSLLPIGIYRFAAAPAGAGLGLLPIMYACFRRKSRLAKFGKQLPEALELISRALRAGHSLASGFRLVGDEMAEPICTEFNRCYEAQNLGQSLETAIQEMTERVPNLDLRFFGTAVILQRQTGGDLAEILDKIGYIVRERFKIFGQIQALTGEGRLSGVVLLALPPVLAGVMAYLNPNYMMKLVNDPMGQQMLAGGIVMQVVGAFVIRKIVDIKV